MQLPRYTVRKTQLTRIKPASDTMMRWQNASTLLAGDQATMHTCTCWRRFQEWIARRDTWTQEQCATECSCASLHSSSILPQVDLFVLHSLSEWCAWARPTTPSCQTTAQSHLRRPTCVRRTGLCLLAPETRPLIPRVRCGRCRWQGVCRTTACWTGCCTVSALCGQSPWGVRGVRGVRVCAVAVAGRWWRLWVRGGASAAGLTTRNAFGARRYLAQMTLDSRVLTIIFQNSNFRTMTPPSPSSLPLLSPSSPPLLSPLLSPQPPPSPPPAAACPIPPRRANGQSVAWSCRRWQEGVVRGFGDADAQVFGEVGVVLWAR